MAADLATQSEGLRGELYAEAHVWVDEIDALLERLSPCVLEDDWVVNDGLYETGAPYVTTCDERYGNRRRGRASDSKTLVQFAYRPSYIGYSEWIPQIRHFWVAYETGGKPEYDVDENAYGNRVFGVDGFKKSKRKPSPKYIVGGPLADPLVTESLPRVVAHVETQFEAVADRVLFNMDIERCYAKQARWSTRDDEHHSPISVGGIGKKSAKRIAKHYGAYSNILLYESVRGASRAYGNRPNIDGLRENVETAVDAYQEEHARGNTRSSLLPEDLVDYPYYAPKWWSSYGPPHTSREDGDDAETDVVPSGCVRGPHDHRRNIGTVRTVVIDACGDGCWRLSPSVDAPETAYEMLVPFGTEQDAETYARAEYVNARSDVYAHDCWIATQILSKVWTLMARWDGSMAVSALSIDPSSMTIPDPTLESWTIQAVGESLRDYLSDNIGWAPTVWSEKKDDYAFRDIAPEIAYLMASMSVNMVSEWSVQPNYYNSKKIAFRYVPTDVEMTTWVQALNEVTVEYTSDYAARFDRDEGHASGAKYVVEDARGDPFVTASVGRVVAHLMDRLSRVASVVQDAAQVERRYALMNGGDGQADVLPEMKGIGSGTARTLAEIHGTYADLLDADDPGVTFSYHFTGGFNDLKDRIRPAVEQQPRS